MKDFRFQKKDRVRPIPGDVWWVDNLRFEDNSGMKDRPILIIGSKGKDIIYRKCTTKQSQSGNRYRVIDTVSAGLDQDTYIDGEKHFISRTSLAGRLGHLSEEDWENLKGGM